jgi:hypothetical protein
MRENWEGATKQICMVLMKDVTHPGINYLVKVCEIVTGIVLLCYCI